jgi:hypothetical protein
MRKYESIAKIHKALKKSEKLNNKVGFSYQVISGDTIRYKDTDDLYNVVLEYAEKVDNIKMQLEQEKEKLK